MTIGDSNLDLYMHGKSINLYGTVYGNCSGAVIRTIYHGPGSPGEIIIGNYDSATAPSLTLTGSSVNAEDLTISRRLILDDNAYIYSGSDRVSLLSYGSGVLYVGASNKKVRLDCTEASVNAHKILTEDNYTNYIGDTYIKSSGGAILASGNADGKPMSGSFYVDDGYKLIAPSYDNDNNREENTNNTLIDVYYNYNSNYTASRYPNFWTIGDTN